MGNGIKLRIRPGASTSPLRGYAQHERFFSARPERTLSLSKGKSKDERNANLTALPLMGEGKGEGVKRQTSPGAPFPLILTFSHKGGRNPSR
jgi:hypothetical protein